MNKKKKQERFLARRAERHEIVARYRERLISYAAFAKYCYAQNDEDKSLVMIAIEWYISINVKRGIEKAYGEDITFLFSVIIEGINSDNEVSQLEEENRDLTDEPYVRPDPELHFTQAIVWFTRHFNGATATVSEESLCSTLHQLYQEEQEKKWQILYTAKREKHLYALVLVPNSAVPERFGGKGDKYRSLAELQEDVWEHYGEATFVAPSDFQREVEYRQVHSSEMIALLVKQSEVYRLNLCTYFVYGSARPISAVWANLSDIEANVQEAGYYTYVAVVGRLDQEVVEDYELTFVSGPATLLSGGTMHGNGPRTEEWSRSEYVEACCATAEQQAEWLKLHLPQMYFTLNEEYATICTVWVRGDPDGGRVFRMGEILRTHFGAYLCGPCSNVSSLGPTYQSFGFWNRELLDYAQRVFVLPEGLQPGRPIYIPSLSEEYWSRVERAYNKRPDALPGCGLFKERKRDHVDERG